MNYMDHCMLPGMYEADKDSEKAEVKIAKHALLEALFQTQVWAQPYIRNPFIYVANNPSDFKSDEGKRLEDYFKRVFYSQHQKYKEALEAALYH
jgi:ABC-type phosphate transport system substrate-binding protein